MDFREIMKGNESGLEKAIRLEAQEGLQLDFNRSASDKDGGNVYGRPQARQRWPPGDGESAFSNSAGGVIVLGVECRKNAEGVDYAQRHSAQ
ncbi:hypothetical protein [Mesorhizobium sp. Root695]|uniref:hypothetical protein n=1 Tax=Mesorhizobium sp. Root695 TaxID=1736589 RepID=UPI0012E3E28A|nr:hypothetical protein [Mesorhizobium sp. Root695]